MPGGRFLQKRVASECSGGDELKNEVQQPKEKFYAARELVPADHSFPRLAEVSLPWLLQLLLLLLLLLQLPLAASYCISSSSFSFPDPPHPLFSPLLSSSCRTAARSSPVMAAEMSPSVPFLKNPSYPEGMVGDVRFDPLGLSENFDMKWLREAELKHGRVCMLACLGYVVQEFVHLPGEMHQNPNPIAAVADVGPEAMLQLIFGVGFIEWGMNKGKMTSLSMFEDAKRVPGDYNFDPMGMMEEGDPNEYALKEITHGRLAMIAFSGMIQQSLITDAGLFGHSL